MDGAAYFGRAVSYKCKMFMKLTTGVNAIKLFFFVIQNKLKCFILGSIFNQSYYSFNPSVLRNCDLIILRFRFGTLVL
jgi:hypothetical protein